MCNTEKTNKFKSWKKGKSIKVVIIFDTPTDAFAFESACQTENIPGRLLPVPVTLSDGCGIGWSSEVSDRAIIEEFINKRHLPIKLITEIIF